MSRPGPRWSISESQYRAWDLALKIVGVPVLIIVAGWTLWDHHDKAQTDRMVRKQETAQQYAQSLFDKKILKAQDLIAKGVFLSLKPTDDAARTDFLASYSQLQGLTDRDDPLVAAFQPVATCLNQKCDVERLKTAVQQSAPASGAAITQEVKKRVLATGIQIVQK